MRGFGWGDRLAPPRLRKRWLALAAALLGLGVGAALAWQLPPFGEPVGGALPGSLRPLEPVGLDVAPLDPAFDGPDLVRERIGVQLEAVVGDVGQPTDLRFVPGWPEQLVVTSKWGAVHRIDLTTELRAQWIWLDVHDGLECGVLGVAFHPDFARNGRLFVNHCPAAREGQGLRTVVTEFRTDPATLTLPERVADVWSTDQPAGTHNGGQIRFGPDGHLYVALGDGAAGGDPEGSGQDVGSPLGALLRLDVSTPGEARPAADNPFVDDPAAHPAVFATGLRNPWRFAFTPDGRLVVGDVGQSRFEEIDVVRAGDNLGWSRVEGRACFEPAEVCDLDAFVPPLHVYGRDEGASVTGGVVWTGDGPLGGRYLFGDFATGRLWAMDLPDGRRPVDAVFALGQFAVNPSSFTVGPDGDVWLADFRSERVYRIVVVPDR